MLIVSSPPSALQAAVGAGGAAGGGGPAWHRCRNQHGDEDEGESHSTLRTESGSSALHVIVCSTAWHTEVGLGRVSLGLLLAYILTTQPICNYYPIHAHELSRARVRGRHTAWTRRT